MFRLASPALLILAAAPALAHPGGHLHPHGGAGWLTVVAGLGVIALAAGLARATLPVKADNRTKADDRTRNAARRRGRT